MTTTEARQALIDADPQRTYCVTEETWHYQKDSQVALNYRISIFDKADNDIPFQESDTDLPTLLRRALDSLHAIH